MTQQQLADLTGIRRTEINAYCKGRKLLGEKNAAVIASALEISLDLLRPPGEAAPSLATLLRHLREFRDEAEQARGGLAAALEAIHADLRRIEARLPEEAGPVQKVH